MVCGQFFLGANIHFQRHANKSNRTVLWTQMPKARENENENSNTRKMRISIVRCKHNLVETVVAINIYTCHASIYTIQYNTLCVGIECVYQLHFGVVAKLKRPVCPTFATFQTTFTQFTNKTAFTMGRWNLLSSFGPQRAFFRPFGN